MQQNGGALRPLTIITRPGSIFEPGLTAPVAPGNHETSMRIVDAIFLAMKDVIPERLSAAGATTAGVLFFAEPRQDGSWKMLYEVHGGGEGARHNRAGGWATRVHLANTSNTPVEVIEANYKICVEQQAIRWGSGGAGKRRHRALLPYSRAVGWLELQGCSEPEHGGILKCSAWKSSRRICPAAAGVDDVLEIRLQRPSFPDLILVDRRE
jgi:hypothetical protein